VLHHTTRARESELNSGTPHPPHAYPHHREEEDEGEDEDDPLLIARAVAVRDQAVCFGSSTVGRSELPCGVVDEEAAGAEETEGAEEAKEEDVIEEDGAEEEGGVEREEGEPVVGEGVEEVRERVEV
jgi:hypothetical protein